MTMKKESIERAITAGREYMLHRAGNEFLQGADLDGYRASLNAMLDKGNGSPPLAVQLRDVTDANAMMTTLDQIMENSIYHPARRNAVRDFVSAFRESLSGSEEPFKWELELRQEQELSRTESTGRLFQR